MHAIGPILLIIISVFIIYHFGFTVFLWCIPLVIVCIVIAFFYQVFVGEGWLPDLEKMPKKIWQKYLKLETKLFKWMDEHL